MIEKSLWTNGSFDISDGIMWFVPINLNLLIKYNINSNLIEEVYSWNNLHLFGASYNSKIIFDKIVVIPARDYFLHILDSSKHIIESQIGSTDNCDEKYYQVLVLDEEALLFPLSADNVITISKDGKIDRIDLGIRNIISVLKGNNNYYLFTGTKEYYCIDFDGRVNATIRVSKLGNICSAIRNGDYFLFMLNNGDVYISNDEDFDHSQKVMCCDDDYFYTGACVGYKAILFPYCSFDKICVVDLMNKEYKYINTGIGKNNNWRYNAFSMPVVVGDGVWVFSSFSQELIHFDNNGSVIEKRIIRTECLKGMIPLKTLFGNEDGNIISEDSLSNVADWLGYITQ